MVIFLVGMPCSGKTIVGKRLAKSLGFSFLDTDREFQKLIKVNPSEFRNLFDEKEKWFRQLEEKVISIASKRKNTVIATGGGSILSKKNRKIFHDNYTFFVDCDLAVISERIKDRIILADKKFKEVNELWEERKKYYKEFDNVILSADYPILIGYDILGVLKRVSNYFISCSFPLIDKDLGLNGNIEYVSDGEELKTIKNLGVYYNKLFDMKLDRYSTVCSIGGGTMGDFFGYLSGTFMRGIRHIMVPTTLLSMVDSSVGGKTGINFGNIKNGVGMFSNPNSVIIDTKFLDSVPEDVLASSMFEVMKYGFIYDSSLLDFDGDKKDLILKCLKIKLKFVEDDPYDFANRRFLNFGHTIGHALELVHNLRHGDAVGYGMLCELHLSHIKGLLSKDMLEYCVHKISEHNLPKLDINADRVMDVLYLDKKKNGRKINFVLLEDLEKPVISSNISEEDIRSILDVTITKV